MIIIIVIILIILLYVFDKYYSHIFIGFMGEIHTKSRLKKLPKDKYTILNDIYINVNDDIHQIDHIVVSNYGIFVIETKQYNGYITGGKYDLKWVRHIGKKKIYYTNPIRQNYGHVKSICELLNIGEDKVFNIVCIPSTAKLNIKHDGELTRYYNLIEKILSYRDEIIFNKEELYTVISNNNITDKKKRKSYIKSLKNKNKKINSFDTCPWCGCKLVLRKGYSNFIGCSNYPNCKYKRKI